MCGGLENYKGMNDDGGLDGGGKRGNERGLLRGCLVYECGKKYIYIIIGERLWVGGRVI